MSLSYPRCRLQVFTAVPVFVLFGIGGGDFLWESFPVPCGDASKLDHPQFLQRSSAALRGRVGDGAEVKWVGRCYHWILSPRRFSQGIRKNTYRKVENMATKYTRQQTLDRLRKTVSFIRPFMWLLKLAFIMPLLLSLISFFIGDLRGSIAGLLGALGCGFALFQYSQYILILELIEPTTAIEEVSKSSAVQSSKAE